jgi:hypothetical protein
MPSPIDQKEPQERRGAKRRKGVRDAPLLPSWPPAAILLALLGPSARAEPIRWDYATFVLPGFVPADGSVPPTPFPWPYPLGVGVNFQGTNGQAAGSASVAFATWWASGWIPPGQQATFTHLPIHIGVGILDDESHLYQTTVFDAYLDGTLSAFGANLTVTGTGGPGNSNSAPTSTRSPSGR